uniref:Uncharacterized protein n=1 Tax=Arundo donax TaxID=35708 RepID=A0A0A8YFY5_ARUDO
MFGVVLLPPLTRHKHVKLCSSIVIMFIVMYISLGIVCRFLEIHAKISTLFELCPPKTVGMSDISVNHVY